MTDMRQMLLVATLMAFLSACTAYGGGTPNGGGTPSGGGAATEAPKATQPAATPKASDPKNPDEYYGY